MAMASEREPVACCSGGGGSSARGTLNMMRIRTGAVGALDRRPPRIIWRLCLTFVSFVDRYLPGATGVPL
jgi:hypothetical protein